MDQMIAWVLVNHCILRMREERRRERRAGLSWTARWPGTNATGRDFS